MSEVNRDSFIVFIYRMFKFWLSPFNRRWFLWGLLSGIFILVNIYRLSTAVIAGDLMSSFEVSGSELGGLHAVFFLVYGLMQIPTGILVDRIGVRKTSSIGGFVMNIGAVLFALSDRYMEAILGRFLIGLGGSVIFVSMLRFCASWYKGSEFSKMNGLSFAIGGLGGIMATAPFALLVNYLGWRNSILSLSSIGFILVIGTFLFVRDSPKRAGFGEIENINEHSRLNLNELTKFLSIILTKRITWISGFLMFCAGGINLTLFGLWGVPYIVQVYNTSVEFASVLTLIGGVGAMVGPPLIGKLSENRPNKSKFIILTGIIYTLSLGVVSISGRPPLIVLAIIFFLTGASFGGFVLTFPLIKDLNPNQATGISLGTLNGAGFFGASIFPTVIGWILDSYWTGNLVGGVRIYTITGYKIAFGLATIAGFIIVLCGILIYKEETKNPRI